MLRHTVPINFTSHRDADAPVYSALKLTPEASQLMQEALHAAGEVSTAITAAQPGEVVKRAEAPMA